MFLITAYRINREWEPCSLEAYDLKLLRTAMREEMEINKIDFSYMETQDKTPKKLYKCLNCGKIYFAVNEGKEGQHMQPYVLPIKESDIVITCFPKCCYRFNSESEVMELII